jgi:hypothetical protein
LSVLSFKRIVNNKRGVEKRIPMKKKLAQFEVKLVVIKNIKIGNILPIMDPN